MNPYDTATTQPAADRREMMSDDPHNEWAANRALANTPKTGADTLNDTLAAIARTTGE